jgi:hypothetical protein
VVTGNIVIRHAQVAKSPGMGRQRLPIIAPPNLGLAGIRSTSLLRPPRRRIPGLKKIGG